MWKWFLALIVPVRPYNPQPQAASGSPPAAVPGDAPMPSGSPPEETRSLELGRRLVRSLQTAVQQLAALIDKRLRAFREEQREVQLQHHTAVSRSVADIAESLSNSTDAHFEKLASAMAQVAKNLDNRVAETLAECTKNGLAAITDKLEDACSTASQRATLRPVIDQLIALHDRGREERLVLGSWYRRDSDMLAHLGCRQLFERCDDILRSVTTESLMILRTFDVVPLVAGGGVFDPRQQRVVAVEPTTNPDLDGQVARIVHLGFMWAGAIHRPEQVVVFKQEPKK